MPDRTDALIDRMLTLVSPATPSRSRPRAAKPPPPRPPSTEIYTAIVNGRLAVSVPLTGALGRGKRMVLDEAVWNRVAAVLGKAWGLQEAKPGVVYVVSRRAHVIKAAGQDGASMVRLARYVAGAKWGEVVSYRDGDTLNLTRGNLEVVSGAAFIDRTFGAARGA